MTDRLPVVPRDGELFVQWAAPAVWALYSSTDGVNPWLLISLWERLEDDSWRQIRDDPL